MAATATLLTRDIQGESLAAAADRLVNTVLIYEGVIMRGNPNSFQTLQNTGTDMNVKVGSTVAFDRAVIQGDSAGQGVFVTEHQNATQVLAVAASDPTNDRIDNVILRIFDDTFDSSGDDFADLEVTTGTPSGSPSPPTVPAGSFVIAEILVQDGVTQIVTGDITDKRVEAPIRGELVKTVYFTSNGTFTKADHAPWLYKVRVRLSASGGGGGAAIGVAIGGGGGGGGYAEKEVVEDDLGTTETVTVGIGGSGGVGGNGGAGQVSSFGSHASGGSGGGGGVDGSSGSNGLGGTASGDLALPGADGHAGGVLSGTGLPGAGGASHIGHGGMNGVAGTVGRVGENYGGGGGGGHADSATDRDGGAGAPGIVIVDLYA